MHLILKLWFSLTFTLRIKVRVNSLGLGFGLELAFFKHLWDNKAHHKLAYNIGNKFDGGGCNYKTCQLATSDSLLGRPEELVGRLAICEATAEVVSHSE